MHNRLPLCAFAALTLAGCGEPDQHDQQSPADTVERSAQPLTNSVLKPQPDAVLLATGLSAATYKDIAVDGSYFYALTTTGLKRTSKSEIGDIKDDSHSYTIQLDAIDHSNTSNYGLVGARSSTSTQNAALVLRAFSSNPTTVSLPSVIGTVKALEIRMVSLTRIRVFVKSVKGSTRRIYEYEYDGSALSLINSTAYSGVANGFRVSDETLYSWVSDGVYNHVVGTHLTSLLSTTEAQNYERTYPRGDTTATFVHGFQGSTQVLDLIPLQIDYGLGGSNNEQSLFILTPDVLGGELAVVRLPWRLVEFNKTPVYTPDYWNLTTNIKRDNNCYNYAANKRTDTYAQPGHASGNGIVWPPSVDEVKNGAVSDGLEFLGNPATIPVPPLGKSLVAAIVGINTPNPDYHWYRKDRDGQYWTHKPGQLSARNKDQNNALITDPRTAAWDTDKYDTFVGFFQVDSNRFEGMGVENIQGSRNQ